MGIDFYDRMWEEEQKEKERFGQRKNEIENELLTQRRKIEELEIENGKLQGKIADLESEYYELENFKDNEIAKLKEQIERMKCCGNCKWYRVENGGETFCDCVGDCIDFDKWEIEK